MTDDAQIYYNRPVVSDWRHWVAENDHRPRFTPAQHIILRHVNRHGFTVITEHWSPESAAWQERQAADLGMKKLS